MSKLTTLTRKNQITIPVDIVRSLGLSLRSKIFIEREKDIIKIKPLKRKSFLDLYGVVKIKKRVDFRKMRKQFEKETAKKAK